MFTIIKNLYDKVKCCVKYGGVLSDYFQSHVGLMQEETLPPLLFSLYVNFIRDDRPRLNLQETSLFLYYMQLTWWVFF